MKDHPTKVEQQMTQKEGLEPQDGQLPPTETSDPFGGFDDDIWGEFPMITSEAPAEVQPEAPSQTDTTPSSQGAPKGAFKPSNKAIGAKEEPADYVDLDSEGLPYDERIHASPKKKNPSNGKWGKKRGVTEDEYKQVLGELRSKHPEPKKREREDTVETFWALHVASLDWGVFYEDRVTPIPYKWDGKVWQPMTDDDVDNEAERFLFHRFKKDYSAGKKRSCVELTGSILTRNKKVLQVIKDRDLFSVQGGTLEVLVDGSIRLLPHNKDLFVRNFIDAPIGPQSVDRDGFYNPRSQEEIEKTGLFGKLVRDSFEDIGVRRAFQEHLGDTLLQENRQETPFLLGGGGNGKSQWIVISKGMHKYHAMADLSNLSGFSMANFIGCSLLLVDEAEKKIDEQMFKRIFGGGAGVQVDRKFKTAVNWDPDIKGLVALNEMPAFSEHSEAIQRRIRPYPMSASRHDKKDRVLDIGKKIINGYKKPGQIKGVEIKVPDQKKDVLDWMLAGAIRVAKRGGLMMEEDMPLACQMEKAQLRTETEPTWAFIEELDWQPVNGAGGVSKLEIYDVYVAWSKANGKTGIMNSQRFGRDFKRNFEKKYGKGSMKDGKTQVRIAGGETGWKSGYKLKAANGAGWEIKYGDYIWDETEQTRSEKAAEVESPTPAPEMVVHKAAKKLTLDGMINGTTGHFRDCPPKVLNCNCTERRTSITKDNQDPGHQVIEVGSDGDIPW